MNYLNKKQKIIVIIACSIFIIGITMLFAIQVISMNTLIYQRLLITAFVLLLISSIGSLYMYSIYIRNDDVFEISENWGVSSEEELQEILNIIREWDKEFEKTKEK